MNSSKRSPRKQVQQQLKEISASGKKLVQARLGFQPLAASSASASPSTSRAKLLFNPTGEDRKRKLSFSSEDETIKKALRSDIKENIDKSIDSETIVLLSDDDEIAKNSSQNVPKGKNLIKQNSNKLVIKLPLTKEQKKKRKKSQSNRSTTIESENSISDLEKNEKVNPIKKIKLDENVNNENQSDTPFESVGKNTENELKILEKNDKCNVVEVCSEFPLTSANELQNSNTTVIHDESELNKISNKTQIIESEICSDSKEINLECKIIRTDKEKDEDLISKNLNNDSQELKNILVAVTDMKTENTFQATVPEKSKDVEIVELSDQENNSKKIQEAIDPCAKSTLNEKELLTPVALSKKIIDDNSTTPNSTRKRNKSITPTHRKKSEKRIAIDLQKMKEKEEREEQKRREKEEREQRRKEKEEREALKKKEREEKDEIRRKEKEEREEIRKKEKEERETKKQAELDAKIEEKRQKEEERRKREEEKRKKELEKEEVENKKKKAAEAFTKFFVAPKNIIKAIDDDQDSLESSKSECRAFMPFQIKGDMKLAPVYRKKMTINEKNNLEKFLHTSAEQGLYLEFLGSPSYKPMKSSRTLIKDEDCDEVILLDDDLQGVGQAIDVSSKSVQKHRAKFLLFCDNRRPPYYGTWSKKSATINPRKPFAIDKILFDYEVDSDDEWEEEEPGESLRGSDDEKESEDEYEVDNDFFVPHGHLSDEELQTDDENIEINTPQNQKAKLKILQQEFAQEMKKKTEKIKPKLIGIFWADENGNQGIDCPEIIWNSLNKRAMMLSDPITLKVENPLQAPSSPSLNKKIIKENRFPEAFICDLIRLLHGNRNSKKFLIKEFLVFIAIKQENNSGTAKDYTKSSIKDKIDEISSWDKLCRVVHSEVLIKYELQNLTFVNQWTYYLKPKIKSRNSPSETMNESKSENNEKTTSKKINIKKLTNNLTNKNVVTLDSNSRNGNSSEITDSIVTLPQEQLKNKLEPISRQKNSSISSFLIKGKMELKEDLANNLKETENVENVITIN